ncbi:N(G),N(G)-dimethylarginine dimethylaminohydrolase 1-like [Clavelina lepadiformis]|uniref:N(G),N(G)-dimethylarginine dimethylaminohydrolase 1-like n=1 Tax=Clavelina lepadiformis TaxID=159417 RepID=UPI004042B1AC
MNNFKYTSVIVRDVSDSLGEEALRMDDGPVVDMEKVRLQHKEYVRTVRSLGLKIIKMDADHSLPDSVFVEDPAVVIGTAVLLPKLGHPSRRPETNAMQKVFEGIPGMKIHKMEDIDPMATLDGGDVLFTGQEIFVGQGSRTNERGVKVLSQVFSGFKVTSIEVNGHLHLKSVCTLAADDTIILATGDDESTGIVKRLQSAATGKYKYLEVKGKSSGANCVYIESNDEPTVIHQSFSVYPQIEQAYNSLKGRKIAVDTSELSKVDGCLTCLGIFLTI